MKIYLRTLKLYAASSGCLVFFVLFVVFVSLYATHDRGGWNLSGPATCTPTSVTFESYRMIMWTTYPRRPTVTGGINTVPKSYVGRNLFGHQHAENTIFSAKIRSITGRTVVLEEAVGNISGSCYITIDTTNEKPLPLCSKACMPEYPPPTNIVCMYNSEQYSCGNIGKTCNVACDPNIGGLKICVPVGELYNCLEPM